MKKVLTLTAIVTALLLTTAVAQPGLGGGMQGSCPSPGMGNCMGPDGGHHHAMKGHQGGPRGHRGGGMALMRFADEIGLSEATVDQIEEMRTNHRKQMVDLHANLEKAQIDLRTMMRDEDAPESAVMRAIDEVAGLEADVRKAQFHHRNQVEALLTDEQKDKLKELMQAPPDDADTQRGAGNKRGGRGRNNP